MRRDRRRVAIDEGWRMVPVREASWALGRHCKRSIAVSKDIIVNVWGNCAHIPTVRPKVQPGQPISH